jgi:hypothetical protein
MSEYHLVGHHVRVFWKDSHPGGGKAETTIFCGQALHKDEIGLWLWGRFFLEKADTLSVREFPKEKDTDMKMYFVPWTSIDTVEIIGEKTKQFEVHQLVMSRTSPSSTASSAPAGS